MQKIALYAKWVLSATMAIVAGLWLNGCTYHAPQEMYWGQSESSSNVKVLLWANEAISTLLSINFVNYPTQLQNASHYFTRGAWMAYQNALNASGNLQSIVERRLVVSATPSGAPVLLTQGWFHGRYIWQVQMPLLITEQSANEMHQDSVVATMIIVKTPNNNIGVRGLAISQLILTHRVIMTP